MEKQNIKNSYLQYFSRAHASRNKSRPSPNKLLPHIQEEYQYRITNHLLIKKIISPKRDKVILNSLTILKRQKVNTSHSHNKAQQGRTQWRQASLSPSQHTHHRSEHRFRTMNSARKEEYSKCPTEHYPQYPPASQAHPRDKLAIIKNDYQEEITLERGLGEAGKSLSLMRYLNEGYCRKVNRSSHIHTNIPYTFGVGPTILSFTAIQLITSPPLRADTLLQLQLIQRSIFPGQEGEQKVVRTNPIAFCDFPREQEPRSRVKFAVRISKIGDFVPLRIWRYAGVQSSEMGTVDIPLNLYRLALSAAASFTDSDHVKWQTKIDSYGELGRTVVKGEVACQLRRGNTVETQARVVICYKVYAKRFCKPKEFQEGAAQD